MNAMDSVRKIKRILKSRPTIEGAGVRLKRAFTYHQAPELDPFLLLDDFHSNNPADYVAGFPWHPHRGIETITYVLHGEVEHGDSMGNKGMIRSGEVQWMTAGSGIIHQEMPQGEKDGSMSGFQLWANLPASHKMMNPRYREIASSQITTTVVEGGAQVRIIAGEVNGIKGPVRDIVTDPEYLDITIPKNSKFNHTVKTDHAIFAYVIEGRAYFDQERDPYAYEIEGTNYFDLKEDCLIGPENLVIFDEGNQLAFTTIDKSVRFLLVSGKPIDEPVAWYGPIVMNTQDELRVAFEEYRNGTFIKHRNPANKSETQYDHKPGKS
jgi:redox-sensitive bicupin YhaK (pirin superfamily)